jgi:PAS domain S-box-containing protein
MEHTGPEVVTLRKLIPLFIKPLGSQGELRMSTSLSPSITQMYKNRHSGHVVQFYTDHDALLDSLSRFVGSALVAGEAAVVLATEAHREGLAQRLKTRGIDTATAIQQGRYVPLDAAAILSEVAPNGTPDLARFAEVIGQILARAQRAAAVKESRIAVFGEMVNVLLMAGNTVAAIQLEQFWNHLATTHSFSLRCAYPMEGFERAGDRVAFVGVCAEHTGVIPAESYTELNEEDRLRRIAYLQQQAQALEAEVTHCQKVKEELQRSHVELQQTSSALRESEERYRVLFRSLPVAVFVCDRNAVIQDYNQRALELWGRAPQCGVERHCGSVKLWLPNGVFLPHTQSPMVDVLRTGVPAKNVEVFIERPDGSRLPVIANFAAVRNTQGEIIGAVTAFEDITERKRAEQALCESEVRLRTANEDLESLVQRRTSALQRLSAKLMRLKDEEHRKIARNLHDSLGQYLASVKMNLDLLTAHVPSDGTALLSDAQDSLEKCIIETRTISHLLHPPLLDEAGFASAARWFVESFAKRSGIESRLDLPERLGRLPERIEVDLFRILQESLTNVHRHSGASSVEIQLKVSENQVLLKVRDFGRGMPAELIQVGANGRNGGVGLSGMRERITDLGGKFEIQSDPHGTAIVVAVPLTEQASGDSAYTG